jgi:hypothetical protein
MRRERAIKYVTWSALLESPPLTVALMCDKRRSHGRWAAETSPMSPSPCSNMVPPLEGDAAETSGVGASTALQACLVRGRWFRGSDAELKARGLCLDSTGARQRLRSPWCHLYWSVGPARFIIGSQGSWQHRPLRTSLGEQTFHRQETQRDLHQDALTGELLAEALVLAVFF